MRKFPAKCISVYLALAADAFTMYLEHLRTKIFAECAQHAKQSARCRIQQTKRNFSKIVSTKVQNYNHNQKGKRTFANYVQ